MLRKPSHPGVYFKFTILDERGITITQASKYLGVTKKVLSEFVNGKTKCSDLMARRLAKYTGTDMAFWINMQEKLDIWNAENRKAIDSSNKYVENHGLSLDKFRSF